MSISTKVWGPALLCAAGLAGCHEVATGLDGYCPDDPMRRHCPSGDCSGEYECVSYCLEHYADREGVPASGLGSWCDDPALPDYAEWCATHPAVAGCAEYCDRYGCEPAGSDGDGDEDRDGDADEDAGPADGDAEDAGEDADLPPRLCEEDRDCAEPGRSRCFEGFCSPCLEDAHCGHLPGLPACVDGTCHQCSELVRDECVGARTHCHPGTHRCVACLTDGDCPLATAAACDATGDCVPCGEDADCAHVPGLPACDGGACHVCDAGNASMCTGTTPRCDAARHVCVECLANGDCPTATASRCDRAAGLCTPCGADADCGHVAGLPACDFGVCWECDAGNATRCTGGEPYCDADRHECVSCLADAHCPTATASRCDTSVGLCAPCATDSSCAHIAGRPACDGGTCFECDADNATACPAARPVCDVGAHACVQCTSDVHCTSPGARRCDTATHSCVACLTSADCTSPTLSRCDTVAHACVDCASDADCAHISGMTFCRTGDCRECLIDDNCAGDELCVGMTCVEACRTCTSDADCPTGMLCIDDDSFTSSSHCVREISISATCPRPWYRRAVRAPTRFVCSTPPSTTCEAVSEYATFCFAHTDCGQTGVDDGYCWSSRCTYSCRDSSGTARDDWCPTGSTCGATTGRCSVP